MLTAAHVTEGAVSVRVRFDADLPGEWIIETLVQVRRLLAQALVTASWSSAVVGLARVDPAAVSTLAGELQVRWGFDAPGGARDGGAEDS